MTSQSALTESLVLLRVELRETQDHAAKLRRAIEAVEAVVPRDETTQPLDHATVNGRPPLKDAITTIFRENGGGEMSLAVLAETLWQRKWVGGENGPSIESIRQAVLALRDKGVLTSRQQEGDKAHLWRMTNLPLPANSPRSILEGG